MVEEISDSNFKSEVMRLLGTVITKVDQNTDEIKSLQNDVRTLSGQFQDVASVVITDTQRIASLEQRADILEQEPH